MSNFVIFLTMSNKYHEENFWIVSMVNKSIKYIYGSFFNCKLILLLLVLLNNEAIYGMKVKSFFKPSLHFNVY